MTVFIDFARLKECVSCVEVVRKETTVRLVQERASWRGQCPFCGGSRGSRRFSVTFKGWQCFSCKRRGDVLRLWSELHGVSVADAALDLVIRFSVPTALPGRG